MATLIIGGTGFIGAAVARRLLAMQRPVVVVARAPERAADLAELGARVVRGDLRDAASLRHAAAGCTAVVHAAGVPRPATWRTFRAVHVDGTRAAIDAARAAGCRRFVNVASQAVLFGGKDLDGVNDACPYPTLFIDPYSQTKAEAERIALAAHDPRGLSVVSLRPAVVWGPGDTTVLPIMARLARSPMGVPMCGDGSNIESTTFIDNLVDAAVAALDATARSEPGGRAYLITDGFTISWKDFLSVQLSAAGVKPRFGRVPALFAVPAAWTLDTVAGGLGLPVPLALFGVRSAMTTRRFVATRARDEFGYVPRVGLDDGLAALRAWVDGLGGVAGLLKAEAGAAVAPASEPMGVKVTASAR